MGRDLVPCTQILTELVMCIQAIMPPSCSTQHCLDIHHQFRYSNVSCSVKHNYIKSKLPNLFIFNNTSVYITHCLFHPFHDVLMVISESMYR